MVIRNFYCFCIYLFVFGGDFFVVLNFIDFDKVWVEFGNLVESGNFVVLVIVCFLFGFYFVGFVFVRKLDKKDELKVSFFKCKDFFKWLNFYSFIFFMRVL